MPCAIRGQRNCGVWCFTICGKWVVWPPVAFTFLQKLMAAGWPQTPTALFVDLAQILTWGEVNKCQTSRGRVNPIIGRWQSWSEPDNGWNHLAGALPFVGWVGEALLFGLGWAWPFGPQAWLWAAALLQWQFPSRFLLWRPAFVACLCEGAIVCANAFADYSKCIGAVLLIQWIWKLAIALPQLGGPVFQVNAKLWSWQSS